MRSAMTWADGTSIRRGQFHISMRIKSLIRRLLGRESYMSLLVSSIPKIKPKYSPLISSIDDPDAIEGAPSGIQVIGKPMKDEELIHVMAIVAEVLNAKA
jgi:hypothetical protein